MVPRETLEKYKKFLDIERRLKPKSIQEYLNYVLVLETEIQDPISVKHRSEIVKAIADIKAKRNWEDQTTWRCSFIIKKFYDFLTMEGIIPYNPYPFNAFRKPRQKEPRFLKQYEFESIVNNDMHLTQQDRVMLWLLWDTALRREELRLLDQKDVNLKEKLIFLPEAKSKGQYGQRYVSMSDQTHALTVEHMDRLKRLEIGPHLLCGEGYQRINPDDITKRIVRAGKVCSKEGYIRITPHALRHSLAVRLKERGASDLEIMMILGHANLEMTRKYAHVTASFAKNIQEKYLKEA